MIGIETMIVQLFFFLVTRYVYFPVKQDLVKANYWPYEFKEPFSRRKKLGIPGYQDLVLDTDPRDAVRLCR